MDRTDNFSMDRFFEQFARMNDWTPWADQDVRVERLEDNYHVVMDLPGYEREAIDVLFDDGVLSVSASHEADTDTLHRRRSVDERLKIPGDIDTDAITASYHNGVLEVTLPMVDPEHDHTGTYIDVE